MNNKEKDVIAYKLWVTLEECQSLAAKLADLTSNVDYAINQSIQETKHYRKSLESSKKFDMRKAPGNEQLVAWEEEGGCEATDGCWVEPDGTCEHGHRSWLLEMGLI